MVPAEKGHIAYTLRLTMSRDIDDYKRTLVSHMSRTDISKQHFEELIDLYHALNALERYINTDTAFLEVQDGTLAILAHPKFSIVQRLMLKVFDCKLFDNMQGLLTDEFMGTELISAVDRYIYTPANPGL